MARPNIRTAGADFAFAAVALGLGLFGAPWPAAAAAFAGSVAVWGWTRRIVLEQMPLSRRLASSAAAILMIALVFAIAYWIGLLIGGHTASE